MLSWSAPEPVSGLGLVYVSKCKQYMIVRRHNADYRLSCLGAQGREQLGSFTQLRSARAEAEKRKSLCG